MCLPDALGKWFQPSLRFPFCRVWPPNRWVAVQIIDVDIHICIFWYEYFMDLASVDVVNRSGKREDGVA